MTFKVYLGLGSNMGDREKNLREALEMIGKIPGTKVQGESRLYETEPVGYVDQDRFLNMAALALTQQEPIEFLHSLQKIEEQLKRTREIHWGPRTLDIDILLIDDLEMSSPELMVPHPRMWERAFVLIPLREIVESETVAGKKLSDLICKCNDREGVVLFNLKRR